MLAKYERRVYRGGALVWAGRYRNLHNLSHWHFECEIIACQSGSAVVMIDNTRYELTEGMCAFCPSESVHYIESRSQSVLLVALFDKSLTKSATDIHRLSSPIFEDRYQVCENLMKIRNEFAQKQPFYGEVSNSLIISTIYSVFRGEPLTNHLNRQTTATVTNYKHLLVEIDKNLSDITFSDASRMMNMSEAYFSRYFKKVSGLTFTRYLNSVRVEKAIDLISSNPDVSSTTLMLKSGFSTLRSFNRVFKEITGFSPRDLPDNYVPTIRTSLEKDGRSFDPTLTTSELF